MKRVLKNTFGLGLLIFLFTACDKESVIAEDGLPKDVSTYIQTHFPEYEIVQIVKDRDGLSLSYDVILRGGYKLEFDRKGKIEGVEGSAKLPDSVIPAPVLAYVKANYPEQYIIDWELDGKGQEVKLVNGLELKFDKNGNFLRLDL